MSDIPVNDIIEELLSDLPYNAEMEITLPSGGTAKLRPITFEEEKQLVSISKKGDDPSFVLIDRCVTGIEKKDILLVDKIYILFKLRELSFGSSYEFNVTCPHCYKQSTINLDLNEMPVVSLDDASSEVEITLPMSKKSVVVKRASVSDEKFIINNEVLFDNLWRFVKSFAGHEDEMVINGVLKKLPAGDTNKIASTVLCQGYGLTTNITVKCSSFKGKC